MIPTNDGEPVTEYVDYGRLHSHGAVAQEEHEITKISGTTGVDHLGRMIEIPGSGPSDVPRFEPQEAKTTGRLGLGLTDAMNPNLTTHKSARQYMDDALRDRLSSRGNNGGSQDVVTILDEPEVGLSPRRERNELRDLALRDALEGSVGIVATNSVVLFEDRSLPRIDLDFPELGIHYPK